MGTDDIDEPKAMTVEAFLIERLSEFKGPPPAVRRGLRANDHRLIGFQEALLMLVESCEPAPGEVWSTDLVRLLSKQSNHESSNLVRLRRDIAAREAR